MLSTAISAAAAFAVAAVLFMSARRSRGRDSRAPWASVLWGSVFLVAAALVAVLSVLGMVEDDPVSRLALSAVLAAGAVAQVMAPAIAAAVPASRHPYRRALVIVAIASACAMLALEIPSNPVVWAMEPEPALLEFTLIFCLLTVLYFLPCRHGALAALGVLALAGVGIAEYFVTSLKSMPIQPGDLFALGTAATVAGSYAYVLSPSCVYGLAFAMTGVVAFSLSWPLGAGESRRDCGGYGPELACPDNAGGADSHGGDSAADAVSSAGTAAATVASTVAAVGDGAAVPASGAVPSRKLPLSVDRRTALTAAVALVVQPFVSYYDALGIRLRAWKPLESYRSQGFLPSFISSAQKMVPPKPTGYRRTEADALIQRYVEAWQRDANLGGSSSRAQAEAQFASLKPSVICIMNESFADLSIFDGLGCGCQGPVRFNAIPDALLRGASYMSAFGAGTCNSEFEFLTGRSMAFLGAGSYPYLTYNLAPVENLARQFKVLGYRAVAMHPNHRTNWNRENVFADMGFDEFHAIEDFAGAPELCRKVTDAATYGQCLDVLRNSESPVFIHNVTMQNHAGYDTGLIPSDRHLDLACPGVDAEVKTWTDEYCALIEASDEAFASFLTSLRVLDRPVVVIMYGDHQPFFTDRYNDAMRSDGDAAAQAERIWQTPYVVWANYDVAGSAQESECADASIGYVGALALQAIGAPLTDYQQALLALRRELPVINVAGFKDARGGWHLPEDDGPADEVRVARAARDDLERMQYRTLFDHGGPVFATRKQAAANQIAPGQASGKEA